MKVCVVVVYMGDLPKWMPIYLQTCYKSGLDFKIFTDCTKYKSEGNVEIINFRKEDLIEKIRNLGFIVDDVSNKKMCDWKTFYGLFFENELREYDYWGIGDLDVFYGDSSKYINELSFKNCDLFSTRGHFMTGHGSFYRNVKAVREIMLEFPKIGELMENKDYMSMDEFKLTRYLRKNKKFNVVKNNIIAADGRYDRGNPFFYCWDEGIISNVKTGKEYFYVHFMNTKNNKKANWKISDSRRFILNSTGIFSN